jgi:hypothetical protein
MNKSILDFLERVHLFPNAREIFVGILITGVEGDLVARPDSPPGTQRAPIRSQNNYKRLVILDARHFMPLAYKIMPVRCHS